jgi:hypothetical protein
MGTVSVVPSITVGGRVFTDLTNIIILGGFTNASGNNCTMRQINGSAVPTAGYTPSGSNKFHLMAMKVEQGGAGGGAINLLHATADLGLAQAGAFTSPIDWLTGNSSLTKFMQLPGTDGDFKETAIDMIVPNGNFVGVVSALTSVTWYGYGFEEA